MKPVNLSAGRSNSCEGRRQVTRISEPPSEVNDLRSAVFTRPSECGNELGDFGDGILHTTAGGGVAKNCEKEA
jgi:hypothetical protein